MLANLVLQSLGLIAVASWALLAPPRRSPMIVGCAKLCGRVARNPLASILLCAAVAAACVAISCWFQVPVPAIHDEFSYLLAGETFAAGRLTNPTHPMWEHFESFHIIQQPSYMSKYQPMQGLLLAAGILLGNPIVGVWLATALAAGSVCWMLRGFVPPRWALIGGMVVAVHPTYSLIWGQGYWGGAVPMAGGAILLGAAVRLKKELRVRDALLLILGVALLANSRPFEGLIVSLVVAVWLLIGIVRVGMRQPKTLLLKLLLPAGLALGCVGATMAYYNQQVTGDPLRLPYQVHEEQYNISPIFIWQSPRDQPEYRHSIIRKFYLDNTKAWYAAQQSLVGAATLRVKMWWHSWNFLLGPVLSLPLLAAVCLYKRPSVRIAGSIALVTFGMTLATSWFMPHYLSPMLPAVILLIVEGLRGLHCWHLGNKHVGHRLVFGILLVFFLFSGLRHAANLTSVASGQIDRNGPAAWAHRRAGIERQLAAKPGKHLVLVRYSANHIADQEWVYNAADIDNARIVWAREMDGPRNGRLLRYFADRDAWLLEPDGARPQIYKLPPLVDSSR